MTDKLFTGIKVDIDGVVLVFSFGVVIAIVNEQGELVYRHRKVDRWYVEYLLSPSQASSDEYKLN